MRRPNRNIEIFSMSVLDLFAACLGAFILISVILFPNYQKREQAAKESEQSLRVCQSERETAQKAVGSCEAALASTFIVVAIEWSASGTYDVDLHVRDPAGHVFSWAKNNRSRTDFPATAAQLSYDNTRGPGVELWQHPKADPGTYEISYHYYRAPAPGSAVDVKGNVFYRNGRVELPPVSLTEVHTARRVASIIVGESGTVEVKIEP